MSYPKKTDSQIVKQTKGLPLAPDTLSVLIAYPKDLTGRLIAEALSQDRNFTVCAHVSSADAVIALVTHVQIHVALIAISLAERNDGFEVMRQIRSQNANIRAIILLETPDPELTVEVFRSGAKGVFSMCSDGYEVLCKCIQCVHNGQIWATAQELNWVMESLRDSALAASSSQSICRGNRDLDLRKLSRREEDVLGLLTEGLSNRDIARGLNLSENTIRNYVFRIFEKLGVSSRAELLVRSFGPKGRVLQIDVGKGGQ